MTPARSTDSIITPLTRKDFVPKVDVRWCPGCGDYAILSTAQKIFPELGIPRENFVIISGIGCSSRFPYYLNTYGFHTIHGRAPTIATGLKVANPDLSVWIITGDGDGLSIGGNHLMHVLRRNLDVTILLFNNRVYGLTKGQYSPTSLPGHKTKTSPMGSIETPINPLCFALASEATFVARTIDTNPKHMLSVFHAAANHKGTSFVEILQNCVIFHDNAFKDVASRDVREDQILMLEHGKPLMFGRDKNKGIRINGMTTEVVTVGQKGVKEDDIVTHNQYNMDPSYAYLLAQMSFPDKPTPMGVLRSVKRPTYADQVRDQITKSIEQRGEGNLQSLLLGTYFWSYHAEGQKPKASVADGSVFRPYDEEIEIQSELKAKAEKLNENPLLRFLREPVKNVLGKYGLTSGIFVAPHDSIAKTIQTMKKNKVECLLVVDGKKLVGIVTERDILLKVALQKMDRETTPVLSLIKIRPEKIHESSTIGYAINKLSMGKFRHLPIQSSEGPLGVLSIRNILNYIYESASGEHPDS